MLIAIDAGNTNICLGAFRGQQLLKEFRICTNRKATADELELILSGLLRGLNPGNVWEGAILASVVPELDATLQKAVGAALGVPLFQVTATLPLPIRNHYHPAEAVGADRLVNAVAAVEQYGAPVIVVDFGTAITVDVVSKQKAYLGGAILPGLNLAAESLAQNTSLLQRIELQKIKHALGRSTAESIRAGIVFGAAGAVALLVKKIEQSIKAKAAVIATGGLAGIVVPHCPVIKIVNPHLTLEGLLSIWKYTRGRRKRA